MVVWFSYSDFNDSQRLLIKFKFIFKLCATNWLTLVSLICQVLLLTSQLFMIYC